MKTKNLTLAEALATGRPFKSKNFDYWIDPNDGKERSFVFSLNELAEPIWEVKSEPREWTLYYSHMTKTWAVKQECMDLSGFSEQVKVREVIE
jgi:hypothetical protein